MKIIFSFLLIIFVTETYAQDSSTYIKTEIIYGRKDGMALTMFMLSPKQNSKGKGIIQVISGNWFSSYNMALRSQEGSAIYINNGYTVFLVMHGSQPRYTIPEEVSDLKRAVRFIRYNATQYKVDPAHIGITGYSSGGHLSLEVAVAGDVPLADTLDPVNKVSSRVQAIAVFFPPTDFLNWGTKNFNATKNDLLLTKAKVAAAFDFKVWADSLQRYIPVTAERKLEIAKETSPIYAVTPDDPPILIIHGDSDPIVPLQQSQSIIKKFNEVKVPAQLVIKKGGGHGWQHPEPEQKLCIDWFDKYLN